MCMCNCARSHTRTRAHTHTMFLQITQAVKRMDLKCGWRVGRADGGGGFIDY